MHSPKNRPANTAIIQPTTRAVVRIDDHDTRGTPLDWQKFHSAASWKSKNLASVGELEVRGAGSARPGPGRIQPTRRGHGGRLFHRLIQFHGLQRLIGIDSEVLQPKARRCQQGAAGAGKIDQVKRFPERMPRLRTQRSSSESNVSEDKPNDCRAKRSITSGAASLR